jgi:hypothetical protein
MRNRYKIRPFESCDFDGTVEAGTVVMPVERCFSIQAGSVAEAESKVRLQIETGQIKACRVYEITPPFGNSESIRAFSVNHELQFLRAYLDPATGVYSEFRRIRYKDLRLTPQRSEKSELQPA